MILHGGRLEGLVRWTNFRRIRAFFGESYQVFTNFFMYADFGALEASMWHREARF